MRAVVIDSRARAFREIEIDGAGSLGTAQEIVGGWIEIAYYVPDTDGKDAIFVNEEGLLQRPMGEDWFVVKGAHQPFVGNAIAMGSDNEGDTAPLVTRLEWFQENIRFIDLNTVALVSKLALDAQKKFFDGLFTEKQAER